LEKKGGKKSGMKSAPVEKQIERKPVTAQQMREAELKESGQFLETTVHNWKKTTRVNIESIVSSPQGALNSLTSLTPLIPITTSEKREKGSHLVTACLLEFKMDQGYGGLTIGYHAALRLKTWLEERAFDVQLGRKDEIIQIRVSWGNESRVAKVVDTFTADLIRKRQRDYIISSRTLNDYYISDCDDQLARVSGKAPVCIYTIKPHINGFKVDVLAIQKALSESLIARGFIVQPNMQIYNSILISWPVQDLQDLSSPKNDVTELGPLE